MVQNNSEKKCKCISAIKSFDYLQKLTAKGMILIFLMQNNVYLWGRKPQGEINYCLVLEEVSQTIS